MSAVWQQVAAELDALEREALESIATVFEAGRQRLCTYAVEPQGNDPRAEPGHVAIGRIETVRSKKT